MTGRWELNPSAQTGFAVALDPGHVTDGIRDVEIGPVRLRSTAGCARQRRRCAQRRTTSRRGVRGATTTAGLRPATSCSTWIGVSGFTT